MDRIHNGFDMVAWQEFIFNQWAREALFTPRSSLLGAQIASSHRVGNYPFGAMFIGMHDEALMRIREALPLMVGYGPPEGTEPERPNQMLSSRDKAIRWWMILGLARWATEGEDGVKEFRRAADHVHEDWQGDDPGNFQYSVQITIAARRNSMVEWISQQCLSPTGHLVIREEDRPLAEFARWMARHLEAGGTRDAKVVARFEDALRAYTKLPRIGVDWPAMALWFKEIYWEGGLTKTPAETCLKLYEVLPEIEKPDFSKRPPAIKE